VIDRSSLLILEPHELAWSLSRAEDRSPAGGTAGISWDQYCGWIRGHEQAPEATDFVVRLKHQLLEHRVDLGNRAPKRILRYAASARGLLSTDRALDLATAQVVLPRLKTTTWRFLDLLDGLQEHLPAERFPRSSRLLEALREGDGELDFFQII
jgi:hypothetical protein